MESAFARWDAAKMQLSGFKKENAKFVDKLAKLESEVSASYGEAEQAFIKHKNKLNNNYRGFTVGYRRSVDANLLVSLMPNAIGFVEMQLKVGDFQKMVDEGAIPEDVAEQVLLNNEVIKGPTEPRERKKAAPR